MGEDERRVGINESLLREVNERIEEVGKQSDVNEAEFVCECAGEIAEETDPRSE